MKIMRFMSRIRNIYFFLAAAVLIVACGKMDDNYKDFIKDGDIIYTGRVDSVQTFSGKNRIALSMLLLSDPKINKVKIYWNNHTDSVVQTVNRTTGIDTVKFLLNNMAEGTYSFDIYTYDQAGHSSVKVSAIGVVYGTNYISSLFNRSLRTISYIPVSKARLVWYGPSAQTIGQEINYTDSLGVNRTII